MAILCRNYGVRTDLLVCTVCRFAVGWDMSLPYSRWTEPSACRVLGRRTSYKFVHLLCLPLCGTYVGLLHLHQLAEVLIGGEELF